MKHYGDVMFTETVKAEQTLQGSREAYEKMTSRPAPTELSERERAFIEARDSFYMATVSETGWPYLQHRGGPAGFLKVLGPTTIAFADYRGNRQYLSKSNLAGDDRVSLFLMDYPNRARLKVAGHARVIDASTDEDLLRALETEGKGRIERLFVIDVEAFDWNCPQFITPRFTEEQIVEMVGDRVEALQLENSALKAKLAALEELVEQRSNDSI